MIYLQYIIPMDKLYSLNDTEYKKTINKYDFLFIKQLLLSNFIVLFKKCISIVKELLEYIKDYKIHKSIYKELENFEYNIKMSRLDQSVIVDRLYKTILKNKKIITELYKLNDFTLKNIINFFNKDNINSIYETINGVFGVKEPVYDSMFTDVFSEEEYDKTIVVVKLLFNKVFNDNTDNNPVIDTDTKPFYDECLKRVDNIDYKSINKHVDIIKNEYLDKEIDKLSDNKILEFKDVIIDCIEDSNLLDGVDVDYKKNINTYLKLLIDNKSKTTTFLNLIRNIYYLLVLSDRYLDIKLQM